MVRDPHVDAVRQQFANPDDPVFQLVPALFFDRAEAIYNSFGRPEMNVDSAWTIYSLILAEFLAAERGPLERPLADSLDAFREEVDGHFEDTPQLLPDVADVRARSMPKKLRQASPSGHNNAAGDCDDDTDSQDDGSWTDGSWTDEEGWDEEEFIEHDGGLRADRSFSDDSEYETELLLS